MRLQTKIILITTPVVIVFMFIIGGISYFQLRRISELQAFERIRTVLAQIETGVRVLYETAEKDVELFSSSNVVENYILTPSEMERFTFLQPTVIRLFSSYQKANPNYYEMRILLPDGYEDTRVTLTDLENVTEDEGDTLLFRAVDNTNDDIFTTIFENPDNKEISFFISKRISLRDPARDPISADKSLRGYLAVTVNLDFIEEAVENGDKEFPSSYFLTDGSGKILFHSDKEQVGRTVSDGMLQSALTIKKNEAPLEITNAGTSIFYFVDAINRDLILFATISKEEVFAASQDLVHVVGLLTLCAILIFSLVLFFLGRRIIVNPIMVLREAAIRLGKGDLDMTIDVNPNDELGDLAESFMEMSRNLQNSQEQIRQLAYHDFLTGLPNRVMFSDFLNRSLARAQRHGEMVALIFIDLDNFKRINDTLGHSFGDLLLKEVAGKLQRAIRDSDLMARTLVQREPDLIARIGGDEFTVVLPYVKEENDASVVARRLLNALNKPLRIEGHEVFVSGSVGITIYPLDAQDVEELVKNADVAMYHAKGKGGGNYQYYSASMNMAALDRLSMETELRQAIERNEFILHYQPQIDCQTGMIVGLEALIRWHHPEKGLVPPGNFIPIAEESNLIVPIGDWVLRSAVEQISSWKKKGIQNVPVSVNLSSPQFQNVNIAQKINDILGHRDIEASYLKIELTESILLNAEVDALAMLQEIKERGVHICLDDFGTGYSSLNYLKHFPIDVLKIDRSFVKNIHMDQKDAEITSAIIALAKCLNLLIVAEGVEWQEQYEFLQKKGCDVIQGFYFHKAMPAQDVEELLRKEGEVRQALL